MTYGDKLRDPRWQKRRLEIFQRDEFGCQSCFRTDSELQVHHKKYLKRHQPWEHPDDLLVTLCVGCHSEVTELKETIGMMLHDRGARSAFLDLVALLNFFPGETVILLSQFVSHPALFRKYFDLAYYGDGNNPEPNECVTPDIKEQPTTSEPPSQ